MMTFKPLINKIASLEQRLAVVNSGAEYTYTDLFERVKYYLSQIKDKGILPSTTTVLFSDYSFDSMSLFLALYQNGNIIVPVTTDNVNEQEAMLNEISVDTVIRIDEQSELDVDFSKGNASKDPVAMLEKLKADQNSGLILFSSGISGKPKAMLHNLDNLVTVSEARKLRSLRFILFLLFDHIGGINTLLQILNTGACIVVLDDRDPSNVAALIERNKVNVLPTTPTFLNLMLISKAYEKYDLSSLKMITYGTEPMPDSLLLRLKKAFPRVKFLQTFGTSETGISKTVSQANSTFMKIDDENIEHKIVDGELWLRSKTQILGYLNYESDSFTDDGWFKTGDLVELSDDNFIKIKGRLKEVINVGGEKVLPVEVESVLLKSKEIKDCRVFGKTNDITGQMVYAQVVLNDPSLSKGVIRKELKRICNENLVAYKVPVKFLFVESIEYNSRFKKVKIMAS